MTIMKDDLDETIIKTVCAEPGITLAELCKKINTGRYKTRYRAWSLSVNGELVLVHQRGSLKMYPKEKVTA